MKDSVPKSRLDENSSYYGFGVGSGVGISVPGPYWILRLPGHIMGFKGIVVDDRASTQ